MDVGSCALRSRDTRRVLFCVRTMTGSESHGNSLEARMTSMTLSGAETSTGAPSRHHGGATALTNTTWLAAQQRKATHQPFQPRPLKMVANLEGKTPPRAPLVSRHAIGNVPGGGPAATEPKARAPSHASVRPREEKKPAPAAPAPAPEAPQFDLGHYDGGLERDESKGRRDTSSRSSDDCNTLAMDSSMDGCVQTTDAACITSPRGNGACRSLRLGGRSARASLGACTSRGRRR